MDLKNKNAAVAIQPANIERKIAELGVNYDRQFKNIIPGFIIAQPFVHEREIDNTIDEIHQSFSFQSFFVKTDLTIRRGEYKFEIGGVPKEDSRRLIDDLQVNFYQSMGINLENSSVNAFIPLASFATETLAQKKLSEWIQIWGDYSFSVNELIVFTKQLGKPFTATDKAISLLVDEDEQDDVVMDGEWSNTQGDITDFSEFIEAATDVDNRTALNSEASNNPMILAHAETQSVLSTDVQEESVKVSRVKVNKPTSRARTNNARSEKSARPTGSLGIAVDRVEKWIVESVYPEKLPKTRNKLMGCIRPFCIIVNKPDVDKIIRELVEEGFLDPETRYFTPCPHMGKYEIKYFFPKADEVRGVFHDFTTRNNTTFLQRHFDFTEHEDKILRQCRLLFTSEKAFEFPHKREGFMKKMYEMFESKENVDPQKVVYHLIDEGLIDIDMDDNVTYFL